MAETTLSKRRYVPLSEAAKISGYTYEYIHRLCRIGKIPCRSMGEKTIVELDALLSETGTILLGGEHVGAIEVDETSPYQLFTPVKENDARPVSPSQEIPVRAGRIAVVGETLHVEDAEKNSLPEPTLIAGEKFPANALPFFSSVGKGGVRSGGVHLAVSRDVAAPSPLPPSLSERHPIHLSVSGVDMNTVEAQPVRSTSIKAVSVMPQTLPAGFVPSIPMVPPPAPLPQVSTPSPISTVAHDHDIEKYTTKLPVLADPTSLFGKALLAVFAFGLLVLPTTLGLGNFLGETVKDFGGSLRSGARTSMAAVGLIDTRKELRFFPHLEDTSKLLSATAVPTGGTQTGIVVTPSSGNAVTDEQIKDVIQKTFSSPVSVVPDAKDAKTGLIKPVFQKNNGTNFIYVMVPFRN